MKELFHDLVDAIGGGGGGERGEGGRGRGWALETSIDSTLVNIYGPRKMLNVSTHSDKIVN